MLLIILYYDADDCQTVALYFILCALLKRTSNINKAECNGPDTFFRQLNR